MDEKDQQALIAWHAAERARDAINKGEGENLPDNIKQIIADEQAVAEIVATLTPGQTQMVAAAGMPVEKYAKSLLTMRRAKGRA